MKFHREARGRGGPAECDGGKRVVVHYEEHRGIPTPCYGETNHFVIRISEIEDIGVRSQLVEPLPKIPQ